jgi:uncharacterized protein involved in response to NO
MAPGRRIFAKAALADRTFAGPPAAGGGGVLLRREPFRLLFPVAALLALVGVLPWLLFGVGLSRLWLGVYHAFTMTQAFLIAVAAGFLGTMIPRRTGAAPLSPLELTLLVAALVAIPIALLFDQIIVAEGAYLIAIVTLAQFALRRLGKSQRTIPASFVLIPFALAAGTLGALALIAFKVGGAPALFALGRSLVEQGVLVPLVMALAPMLTPIILDDKPPLETRSRRLTFGHVAIGLLFLGSFALQLEWPRLALFIRGILATFAIVVVSDLVRRPRARGLHRRVYQLAMLLVPLGLLAAAALPTYYVPLLHLTFVGGLALLVFAVGAHVTFLHTGRELLARERPWPIALVALLTMGAAIVRASAERVSSHYITMLGLAATLWLSAALLWGIYLTPMMLRRKP